MNENLDWGGIGYKKFQKLCIPLSTAFYSGRKFKEHLGTGQRQDGIDLKSFELQGQPQIYIQCKNEKGFDTEGKLKEAIQEFTNGIFCTPGVCFTILASADQRKEKFQGRVEAEKVRLRQTYGVTFECWDVNDLQEELRNHWRLVDRYFSRNEAEDFCNARFDLDVVQRLAPVANMMPRFLVERPTSKKDQKLSLHELFWSASTAPKVDLPTVLATDGSIHQYCILGEPYHGKSTYLRQAAYELATGKAELLPILIELKNVKVQSVEILLDDAVGPGWREKAHDELVIILDAVDEVRDDRITDMATSIRAFTESYPYTKIVLSCRLRHFKDFKVDETLLHFKIFELAQLESEQILTYLRSRLGARAKIFTEQAALSGLNMWLSHPFYLTTLIEEFERSGCLPKSPLEAIKTFVERAYEKASSRQIAGGVYVDDQPLQFKALVNKFAMALQMTGKNAFSKEDLDNFFPSTTEKELLRNNPLITELKGQWSFTNTFLQEHLAASVLTTMEFEEIPEMVWAGKTNKKIKTKWVQTLASAISLLPESDPIREKLIDLMQQDSPELIFDTDPSSYPDHNFRLDALKKLLSYMLTNNMWPLRTRPEKIGRFMDGTTGAARFLINQFRNEKTPSDKREYCCRILQSMSLSGKEKKEILSLTLDYLERIERNGIAYELVRILAVHRIGGSQDVATVLSNSANNLDHFFRCRVYEWICNLDLTGEFWEYAIEGLPIWVEANRPTSQGGSDIPLAEFLLELTTVDQAKALFEGLSSVKLIKFSKISGSPSHPFFTALFDRCAEIYSNGGNEPDTRILIPISHFLKQTGRHYQHENYPEIDDFLEKTRTRTAIAKILMDDILVEEPWILWPLIPEESLDEYLTTFKDRKLKPRVLRNVGNAIYPGDAGNLKREFAIRANAAAGEEILPVLDLTANEKYWQAQRERSENNIRTIQNREEFRKAIQRYFALRETPLNDIHDLFETVDHASPQYNARTPLIEEFLRRYFDHGICPTLDDCLEDLESDENFEYFCVTELMEGMPGESDLQRQAENIIQKYYYKKLPECNFENTYWSTENGFRQKDTEHLIGCIFLGFGFSTPRQYLPEFLWLDRIGIRAPERAFGGSDSGFYRKIEEQLGGVERAKSILSKAVIDHLKTGIKLEIVHFAHLSIAAHLKLYDALPFFRTAIYSKEMDSAKIEDLCKFYVLAGGEKEDLLPLLQSSSPGDYYYLHLVRELGNICPVEVEKECLKHLSDSKVENRSKAHIARELATLGSLEGLKYLATYLKVNSEVVAMMQLNLQVASFDTAAALKILFEVADILVDPQYNVTRPPSARHVLRDWLGALSRKSEADLILVTEFLQRADEELGSKFPGPSELKWHTALILENSRNSNDQGMEVRQVKKILHKLEPLN